MTVTFKIDSVQGDNIKPETESYICSKVWTVKEEKDIFSAINSDKNVEDNVYSVVYELI